MKFRKGDTVRFLNAVGQGKVTKVTTDGTIYVLDDTGFEVPVTEDELIIIGSVPDEPETLEPEPEVGSTEIADFYPETNDIEGNDHPNALFALVPHSEKDPTDADLEAFLINDSNYIIFYNLIEENKMGSHGIDAGIVEPNTKIELFTLLRHEIGKSPDYIFQLIFYKKGNYTPNLPIHKHIVISPIKLYKDHTFKENEFFHEKSVIFNLLEKEETTEDVIERTETEKKLKELQKMANEKATSDLEKPKRPRKSQKVEKREIDLHINNLIDDVKGLENKDILEIQMEKFHSEMKSAIADNLKRIVFIHGIGNGTLKNEVRKALTGQYSKYEFHDASYKEYGFGATLVIITN
ncbi:MAG: DUF2027 domain-containing protein [Salinivirgaceae bacterium]|jgi:hypothetical protein|nr:DUF2027 domain-containing protein [Salinivirgaceae bacterium]